MIRAKKNENNFSAGSHAREMRVEPSPGLVALHLPVSSDVAQRRRTVFSRFHFGEQFWIIGGSNTFDGTGN